MSQHDVTCLVPLSCCRSWAVVGAYQMQAAVVIYRCLACRSIPHAVPERVHQVLGI